MLRLCNDVLRCDWTAWVTCHGWYMLTVWMLTAGALVLEAGMVIVSVPHSVTHAWSWEQVHWSSQQALLVVTAALSSSATSALMC